MEAWSRGIAEEAEMSPPNLLFSLLVGVDVRSSFKAVQRMLGHASAAMTLDVYAGLFADDLDALAEGLDRARSDRVADQVRTASA